jgi:hypothetical protein
MKCVRYARTGWGGWVYHCARGGEGGFITARGGGRGDGESGALAKKVGG